MTQSIGAKIRKIRELKGYSQDYVSSKIGVSQNAYSKIENGLIKLDNERLSEIAAVFEIEKKNIIKFNENLILASPVGQENKIQELYEKIIDNLQSENEFLKKLLNDKIEKHL